MRSALSLGIPFTATSVPSASVKVSPGVVTFKNARSLQETVRDLPLERLVLETDCPYLAPHPFRGKPNEPARVALVVRQLAALHDCDPLEMATVTSANARRLFRLPEG